MSWFELVMLKIGDPHTLDYLNNKLHLKKICLIFVKGAGCSF